MGSPASRLRLADSAALLAAAAVLGWLFFKNAMLASRVIDGTRYFLLDDDMMISMRYGRNLVEGHGLVWNAGERVEGYTNFLWTLVMAAVHVLPISDAKMALAVKAINFGLLTASFYFAVRLLRVFAPRSKSAVVVLLVAMVTCVDILHWSVWGFETSLLTFLDLAFLLGIARQRPGVFTFGALALIPLTRGDGLYVFAGNVLVAAALSKDRRRTLLGVAAACTPAILHLAFRRGYYGDWFPNTYYLKVAGLDAPLARGATYARNFLLRYSVLLVLASGAATAIMRRDRRAILFFGTTFPTLGWVCLVGGDMFQNFRFFAHVMPVVFVFAAAGIAVAADRAVPRLVWATVLLLVSVPLVRPLERLVVLDTNGDPLDQIEVAILLKKNARPESRVAVIAAGIVPYFTRMKAIDILGKSDRHIARLTPSKGAMVGHGKLDPEYTLGQDPDLVVSCRSQSFAAGLPLGAKDLNPVTTFLGSAPFQTRFRPYPIHEDFLVSRTAIYTHAGSSELARRQWQKVDVRP